MTAREEKICKQYSEVVDGQKGCNICPLVINQSSMMCRKNSHYDNDLMKWVRNSEDET